ncbi:MAG: hypothetical protein VX594_09555 [Actinomycetota bacterium]|nr:hypothetical protein [Actinomycetota bacterium]
MCGISADSTVTVLSNEFSEEDFKSAVLLALEKIGCRLVPLTIPFGNRQSFADLLNQKSASLAFSRADLVIDLTHNIDDAHMTKLPLSETRVLTIDGVIANNPQYLMTSTGIVQRAKKVTGLLSDGGHVVISSPSGTQLSFDLTDCPIKEETGVPLGKGMIAKWPSGSIELFPDGNDIDAEIIVMPGDIILEAQHIVKSPVRLEVARGNVVEIEGESSDANLIKAQLEYHPNVEDAYTFRSVCLGLCLRPGHEYKGPFDRNKTEGMNSCFTAGWVTLTTGSQDLPALSITMTNASVMVENVQIFSNGKLSASLNPDIYELTALDL